MNTQSPLHSASPSFQEDTNQPIDSNRQPSKPNTNLKPKPKPKQNQKQQRPQKQQLSSAFRPLFTYFLHLGVDTSNLTRSSIKGELSSVLIERFPLVDYSDNKLVPIIPTLWMFAFPGGLKCTDKATPLRFSLFILTGSTGQKSFAASIQFYIPFIPKNDPNTPVWRNPTFGDDSFLPPKTWYAPQALVLLSDKPYFSALRYTIQTIYYSKFMSNNANTNSATAESSFQTLIYNLLTQVPQPLPGQKISFCLPYGSHIRLDADIVSPLDFDLPPIDFSLFSVMNAIGITDFLTIYRALLLEKKVVLVSSSITLLTLFSYALTQLLYPFQWFHLFAPLLPKQALGVFIESLQPCLVGISKQSLVSKRSINVTEFLQTTRILQSEHKNPLDLGDVDFRQILKMAQQSDVFFVDLDDHQLYSPPNIHLPAFPRFLGHRLEDALHAIWDSNLVAGDSMNLLDILEPTTSPYPIPHLPTQILRVETGKTIQDTLSTSSHSTPSLMPSQPIVFGGPRSPGYVDVAPNRVIRETFCNFTFAIVSRYRDFLIMGLEAPIFEKERFLHSFPPQDRRFLRDFIDTQAFERFIALFGSNQDFQGTQESDNNDSSVGANSTKNTTAPHPSSSNTNNHFSDFPKKPYLDVVIHTENPYYSTNRMNMNLGPGSNHNEHPEHPDSPEHPQSSDSHDISISPKSSNSPLIPARLRASSTSSNQSESSQNSWTSSHSLLEYNLSKTIGIKSKFAIDEYDYPQLFFPHFQNYYRNCRQNTKQRAVQNSKQSTFDPPNFNSTPNDEGYHVLQSKKSASVVSVLSRILEKFISNGLLTPFDDVILAEILRQREGVSLFISLLQKRNTQIKTRKLTPSTFEKLVLIFTNIMNKFSSHDFQDMNLLSILLEEATRFYAEIEEFTPVYIFDKIAKTQPRIITLLRVWVYLLNRKVFGRKFNAIFGADTNDNGQTATISVGPGPHKPLTNIEMSLHLFFPPNLPFHSSYGSTDTNNTHNNTNGNLNSKNNEDDNFKALYSLFSTEEIYSAILSTCKDMIDLKLDPNLILYDFLQDSILSKSCFKLSDTQTTEILTIVNRLLNVERFGQRDGAIQSNSNTAKLSTGHISGSDNTSVDYMADYSSDADEDSKRPRYFKSPFSWRNKKSISSNENSKHTRESRDSVLKSAVADISSTMPQSSRSKSIRHSHKNDNKGSDSSPSPRRRSGSSYSRSSINITSRQHTNINNLQKPTNLPISTSLPVDNTLSTMSDRISSTSSSTSSISPLPLSAAQEAQENYHLDEIIGNRTPGGVFTASLTADLRHSNTMTVDLTVTTEGISCPFTPMFLKVTSKMIVIASSSEFMGILNQTGYKCAPCPEGIFITHLEILETPFSVSSLLQKSLLQGIGTLSDGIPSSVSAPTPASAPNSAPKISFPAFPEPTDFTESQSESESTITSLPSLQFPDTQNTKQKSENSSYGLEKSSFFVTARSDGVISLWDPLISSMPLVTLSAVPESITVLYCSNFHIFCGTTHGQIFIFDLSVSTSEYVMLITHSRGNPIAHMAYSNNQLFVSSVDGLLCIWGLKWNFSLESTTSPLYPAESSLCLSLKSPILVTAVIPIDTGFLCGTKDGILYRWTRSSASWDYAGVLADTPITSLASHKNRYFVSLHNVLYDFDGLEPRRHVRVHQGISSITTWNSKLVILNRKGAIIAPFPGTSGPHSSLTFGFNANHTDYNLSPSLGLFFGGVNAETNKLVILDTNNT